MKNDIDYKKEFEKLFNEMCYRKGLGRKESWRTLMLMFACALSNPYEPREEIKEKREEIFEDCKERLGGMDIPSVLLAYVMQALQENPAQDFLGDMYMKLSMGEKSWGQCFTPYHICSLMTRMTFEDPKEPIDKNGFMSVSDPCVGGGAMLVAAVEILREKGYDPKTQMLAFGQDIDITAVNMAYIQFTLIGCPAVLVCGNSLTEPYTGNFLFYEMNENYWYTPWLLGDAWHERRVAFRKEYEEKEEKSA